MYRHDAGFDRQSFDTTRAPSANAQCVAPFYGCLVFDHASCVRRRDSRCLMRLFCNRCLKCKWKNGRGHVTLVLRQKRLLRMKGAVGASYANVVDEEALDNAFFCFVVLSRPRIQLL